jgi:hypothetical protein
VLTGTLIDDLTEQRQHERIGLAIVFHDIDTYAAPVIVTDDHDGADVEDRARHGVLAVGADQVAAHDPVEVDRQLAH